MYRPDRNFAELGTGTVTLSVVDPERMGSLRSEPTRTTSRRRRAAARAQLEKRGITFAGDIVDTGVCHMAFFTDPDGNALMLRHLYARRIPEA
jgi:hypothetical protein